MMTIIPRIYGALILAVVIVVAVVCPVCSIESSTNLTDKQSRALQKSSNDQLEELFNQHDLGGSESSANHHIHHKISRPSTANTQDSTLEPIYFGPHPQTVSNSNPPQSTTENNLDDNQFMDLISLYQQKQQLGENLPNSFYSLDNNDDITRNLQPQTNLQQQYYGDNGEFNNNEEIILKAFGQEDKVINNSSFGAKVLNSTLNKNENNIINQQNKNNPKISADTNSNNNSNKPLNNHVKSSLDRFSEISPHNNIDNNLPIANRTVKPTQVKSANHQVKRYQNHHEYALQVPVAMSRPKPINMSLPISPAQPAISPATWPELRPTNDEVPVSSNDPERRKLSTVSVEEIENLLHRLKPLAINEQNETPESENVDDEEEDNSNSNDDDDDYDGRKESRKIEGNSTLIVRNLPPRNEEDLERLSKSSPSDHHHRGGSSSGAAEIELNKNEDNYRPAPSVVVGTSNNKQQESSQELDFLRALIELGSNLSLAQDKRRQQRHPIENRQQSSFYAPPSQRSFIEQEDNTNNDDSTNNGNGNGNGDGRRALRIPIDELVDHLMSSSRMASFGVHHDDANLRPRDTIGFIQHDQLVDDGDEEDNGASAGDDGQEEEEEVQDDEEDEDDQDDDDQDNNGTLPSSDDQTNDESAPVEVFASSESGQFNSPLFDDNNSTGLDSWIPLRGLHLATNHSRSNELLKRNKNQKSKVKKKRKRKKKKKKKRKRTKGARRKRRKVKTLSLVIGDKVLGQRDLMKLIGVLNKKASSKEPSKERDSARRLLKFLVKMALSEYKKDNHLLNETLKNLEDRKKNKDREDSIGELLRSILLSPIGTETSSNESQAKLKVDSVELRPYRLADNIRDYTQAEDELPSSQDEHTKKSSSIVVAVNNRDNEGKKGKGIDRISDDLENYFDNEFYEDLADSKQHSNDNNKTVLAEISHSIGSESSEKPSRQRRRRRRRIYSLPVPIYGHQHLEDADEDDVDLDNNRRFTASSSSGKSSESERRKRRMRIRAKSKPPKVRTRRRHKQKRDKSENHEREDADGNATEGDKKGLKIFNAKGRNKSQSRRKPAKQKQSISELNEQEEEEDRDGDDGDVEESREKEKGEIEDPEQKEEDQKQADEEKANEAKEDNQIMDDKKNKSKKSKEFGSHRKEEDKKSPKLTTKQGKRKRANNSISNSSDKGKATAKAKGRRQRIEKESRDEIPAPIVSSGQMRPQMRPQREQKKNENSSRKQ